MSLSRRWLVGSCAVVSLMLAAGCAQEAKDMEIQSLRDRLNKSEAELAEKDNRLRALQAERDQLAQRAADLDRRLQQMMAEGGTGRKVSPDFTEVGPYSYAEIEEEILFDSGKAALKDTGRTKLQSIATQIEGLMAKRSGGGTVFVVGHTDTDPIKNSADKWIDNLDLSVNRAANVARQLYRLGVPTQSVMAGGQGEYNPQASNNTKDGKQKNRRVQIVIGPPLKATVKEQGERRADAPVR